MLFGKGHVAKLHSYIEEVKMQKDTFTNRRQQKVIRKGY